MDTIKLDTVTEPTNTPWQLPNIQTPYTLSPSYLLEEQALMESEVRSYPRRIPLAIKQALGSVVTDEKNRAFIDCLAGAGALALGHNHKEINNAIITAMQSLVPAQTLDLTTPSKNAFMHTLLNTLPDAFSQTATLQFCGPSGADAVEAAVKLAKIATGRKTICSFHGGYHGMTHGALSLTGNLSAKSNISNLMSDVHFMPYPYALRSAFDKKGDLSKQHIHYIRTQLSDPESGITLPAAMIVEPVQGEGGVIPAPDEWLQDLRALCDEFQILLIVDEIQSGFGRTGKMFAFEHAGITPDIVVMSKALGGGLPLAMIAFHKELDVWSAGAHTGTFRGNQLAMVAGRKTMQIIHRDKLQLRAAKIGNKLLTELNALAHIYSEIAEVRGRGLMIGIEFTDKNGTQDTLGNPLANPAFAQEVQYQALRRGLICEIGGRHGAVLRLLPPLIITDEQVTFIIDCLRDAISTAHSKAEEKTSYA